MLILAEITKVNLLINHDHNQIELVANFKIHAKNACVCKRSCGSCSPHGFCCCSCAANSGLKISAALTFAAPQEVKVEAINFASKCSLKDKAC